MPKLTNFPKLRVHVRRGKDGRVKAYYSYDMRGTGEKDVNLGTDRDEALKAWDEIAHKRPRIKGTLEEAFLRWEAEALPAYQNEGTLRTYRQHLAKLRSNGIGLATWEGVKFVDLKGYLKKRKAKTQGNREMALLSIIWNYARGEGLTELPWPAAGMEKARWKNKETPRRYKVTDAVFDAIYAKAEPMLKDCMDLATATGMRLTDCRTISLPGDGILRLKASKTGKDADFDLALSQVLPGLVERRRGLSKALHVMLLSMPNGKPVTEHMLRGAYDRARAAAAEANPELAEQIKKMVMRDCRKRAASLSGSLAEAKKLLQHGSDTVTRLHYYPDAEQLRPVR